MSRSRVLIVEDDAMSATVLRRALSTAGYEVAFAADGHDGIARLGRDRFDAVVTDWMMPRVDGLTLLRWVRENLQPSPVVVMVTALALPEARQRAFEAGADAYVAKPCHPKDVVRVVGDALARGAQPLPVAPPSRVAAARQRGATPPFVPVGIAASTGGPRALFRVLEDLGTLRDAVVLVVLHGPGWMLQPFAERLADALPMPLSLGGDGMAIRAGCIHLAPGEHHLVVDRERDVLRVTDGPPENYARPAADPLFRSIATAYGPRSVAVVLTGLGRDGSIGCGYVALAGGVVLVQDPTTAEAPGMPRSVLDLGIRARRVPLDDMGAAIGATVSALARGRRPAAPAR